MNDINFVGDGDTTESSPITTESSSVLRQRQIPTDNSAAPARLPKSTVKVSPLKRPLSSQETPVSANESLNSSRSSSDAKMILKHFEFLRIVMCVMVAYLCRRVLITGYGVFYFQVSVTVRFGKY